MTDKTKIAIQKIQNNDIKTAVFKALDDINAQKLMKNEDLTVVIKPNILMGKPPERAVNTHPEVIRSVIQWVKQFNAAKIYVCDSSGGQKPGVTKIAMKESGIQAVCEEEGVECISFEKLERETYKVQDPLELKEFISSRLIKDADIIINIPKIKTHWQCVLTCCIKNMFGTLLLGNKAKVHGQFPALDKFNAALADVYSVSKPQLTVIDGFLCQEGDGPTQGDVVKLDLILAGYDGVALDTAVCKIIGFDPKDVLYLAKAEKKGLGTTNLENVEFLGEKIEDVFHEFKRPKRRSISIPLPKWLANYIGNKIFKATVKFNKNCKLCNTCWSNCPTRAITRPNIFKKVSTPNWHKKQCITCYCCVELCPHEAIKFKISYIKNALFSWLGIGIVSIVVLLTLLFIWIF
ncbi:MAG: DUF362 domain-containing protein [Candidatus Hodarchaeota archaeon]